MATSKKMGEKRQNIRKRFGMQKSLTKTNSMQIFSYVGYLNVSQHTQRTLLFVRWIAVARFIPRIDRHMDLTIRYDTMRYDIFTCAQKLSK